MGTEKTRPENLYKRILEHIKQLIDSNEINVVSSLPQKDLVWETAQGNDKIPAKQFP